MSKFKFKLWVVFWSEFYFSSGTSHQLPQKTHQLPLFCHQIGFSGSGVLFASLRRTKVTKIMNRHDASSESESSGRFTTYAGYQSSESEDWKGDHGFKAATVMVGFW